MWVRGGWGLGPKLPSSFLRCQRLPLTTTQPELLLRVLVLSSKGRTQPPHHPFHSFTVIVKKFFRSQTSIPCVRRRPAVVHRSLLVQVSPLTAPHPIIFTFAHVLNPAILSAAKLELAFQYICRLDLTDRSYHRPLQAHCPGKLVLLLPSGASLKRSVTIASQYVRF